MCLMHGFSAGGRPGMSLSTRLPNYLNGARLCIHGTILETTQCLTQPTIEVSEVRA